MTAEDLESMNPCSFEDIPKSSLADIRNVKIDTSDPGPRRMLKYLEQIRNPYFFLCDGTPVQVSFDNDQQELSRVLVDYFRVLK